MLVLVLAVRNIGRTACSYGRVGVVLVWVALAGARCLPMRAVGVERSVRASGGLSGARWHGVGMFGLKVA